MRRAAALAVTAFGLFACGSDGLETMSASCTPSGNTIRVSADGFQFDSDCVAAPAGEDLTVEFTNDDWEIHNFTVLTDPNQSLISPNTPFTVTARSDETATATWPPLEAGTYRFLCTIHTGMRGAFIVA